MAFDLKTIVANKEGPVTTYTAYLLEKDTKMLLPICFSSESANSLLLAQNNSREARPHIHNTASRLVKALKGKVKNISISGYRNEIFYSYINVEHNGSVLSIDAKPSDAIAIALRENIPIEVDEDVLECAGIKITSELLQASLR